MTISAHHLMPMFTARSRADGTPVRCDDIWQRKNLLSVSLPDEDPVPSPGIVVADRWGEVYYVQEVDLASGLPHRTN